MSSESLRTVRDRFSEFIDRVHTHHERVVVTRNGTPAAVLIIPDDLETLEETLAVLGDTEAVAELVEAHRAYLEATSSAALEPSRPLDLGEPSALVAETDAFLEPRCGPDLVHLTGRDGPHRCLGLIDIRRVGNPVAVVEVDEHDKRRPR